jgi:selenium donor protein
LASCSIASSTLHDLRLTPFGGLAQHPAIHASCTFSKAIDDSEEIFPHCRAHDMTNLCNERGLDLYNHRHRLDVLERMLMGGLDKIIEADCTGAGGHTARDTEIKFGYAFTGTVDPQSVWMSAGARPGDVLFLTKPRGTGVITAALRAAKAKPGWIDGAVRIMSQLNRDAAQVLGNLRQVVRAATDITGFGLLGQAWEVASAPATCLLECQACALPHTVGFCQ